MPWITISAWKNRQIHGVNAWNLPKISITRNDLSSGKFRTNWRMDCQTSYWLPNSFPINFHPTDVDSHVVWRWNRWLWWKSCAKRRKRLSPTRNLLLWRHIFETWLCCPIWSEVLSVSTMERPSTRFVNSIARIIISYAFQKYNISKLLTFWPS